MADDENIRNEKRIWRRGRLGRDVFKEAQSRMHDGEEKTAPRKRGWGIGCGGVLHSTRGTERHFGKVGSEVKQREIPFTSLQFPLYEFLELRLARALDRQTLDAHEAALCGSFAGGVAAVLTIPLDVLKTRTMLDLGKMSATNNPSLFSRFKDICVKEGVKALFAGVVPRTLWISAGGVVFLGAYEWSVQSLMNGRLHD